MPSLPAFWPADATGWATIGTLLVAVAALVFAIVQLRDARRIRREASAPYVIAQFESSEAAPDIIDFVIKNIGVTPAFDIHVDVAPPMVRAKEIPKLHFMKSKPLTDGIKMLAPNQEVRMFFDTVAERTGKELPSEFTVTITAMDSRRRHLTPGVFNLDVGWGRGATYATVHNMHWIGTQIELIQNSVTQIARSETRR